MQMQVHHLGCASIASAIVRRELSQPVTRNNRFMCLVHSAEDYAECRAGSCCERQDEPDLDGTQTAAKPTFAVCFVVRGVRGRRVCARARWLAAVEWANLVGFANCWRKSFE